MQGAAWPLEAASGDFQTLGLNKIDRVNVLSKRFVVFKAPEYKSLPVKCFTPVAILFIEKFPGGNPVILSLIPLFAQSVFF